MSNCVQTDGTFRYEVHLTIDNIPIDFDKTDFLNHLTSLDNISSDDLASLTQHITLVYKTFPSQIIQNVVTVAATTEIYFILDNLNNSIVDQYCVQNDCSWTDDSFRYYALVNAPPVSDDYDKTDFINFITSLENISSENLSVLQSSIVSVSKWVPNIEDPFLQRVLTIVATSELFPNLAVLNNSLEHYSCTPEPILMGTKENNKARKSIVFPNPITENSILKLDSNYENVKIEMINSVGQVIYKESILGNNLVELKNAPIVNGIYFLKINDLTTGTEEILKVIK